MAAARASERGTPIDGALLEYVNLRMSGPIMLTMRGPASNSRTRGSTQAHRHTGNSVYQAALGRGYSVIGGRRFEWQEKDIFVVPTWY
jgi:gentisate 1,2-dioxygenase